MILYAFLLYIIIHLSLLWTGSISYIFWYTIRANLYSNSYHLGKPQFFFSNGSAIKALTLPPSTDPLELNGSWDCGLRGKKSEEKKVFLNGPAFTKIRKSTRVIGALPNKIIRLAKVTFFLLEILWDK